jgi:hypothetical protein
VLFRSGRATRATSSPVPLPLLRCTSSLQQGLAPDQNKRLRSLISGLFQAYFSLSLLWGRRHYGAKFPHTAPPRSGSSHPPDYYHSCVCPSFHCSATGKAPVRTQPPAGTGPVLRPSPLSPNSLPLLAASHRSLLKTMLRLSLPLLAHRGGLPVWHCIIRVPASIVVLGRPAGQVFARSQGGGKGGWTRRRDGGAEPSQPTTKEPVPGSRYPWCLGGPTDDQKEQGFLGCVAVHGVGCLLQFGLGTSGASPCARPYVPSWEVPSCDLDRDRCRLYRERSGTL